MGKFYEYEVLADDKVVVRGRNLRIMLEETEKKYPKKKISIRYIPPEGILIATKEFELPVAIADSDDVLPILGRVKGLDLFNANLDKGKGVSLEE